MTPDSVNGLFSTFSLGLVATIVVHIAFAIGIFNDATKASERKAGLFLVAPWVWALATLVSGIPIAAVYWVIHYSTLRPRLSSDLPA